MVPHMPVPMVIIPMDIQLTRTNHHINYLKGCQQTKSILKSLRTNLTPQVPIVSSTLHLKWEEAQLNFGLLLTSILLEYWENRKKSIDDEIEIIMSIIKKNTHPDELDFMTRPARPAPEERRFQNKHFK